MRCFGEHTGSRRSQSRVGVRVQVTFPPSFNLLLPLTCSFLTLYRYLHLLSAVLDESLPNDCRSRVRAITASMDNSTVFESPVAPPPLQRLAYKSHVPC